MKQTIESKNFNLSYFVGCLVNIEGGEPWLIENDYEAAQFVNHMDYTMTAVEDEQEKVFEAAEELGIGSLAYPLVWIYRITFENGDRGIVAFSDERHIS